MKLSILIAAFSYNFSLFCGLIVPLDEVKGLISDEIIEAEHFLRQAEYPSTARSYWIGRMQCASDLFDQMNAHFIEVDDD